MTTTHAPAAPASAAGPRSRTNRPSWKLTGPRVLRSEWTKFWSLRSSAITLSASVVVMVLLGAIASFTYDAEGGGMSMAADQGSGGITDPVGLALTGATFVGLIVGVLGVLMSAGEYGTGMVRSTYTAVPARFPVLWGKAVVIGALAMLVTTAGALVTFVIGSAGLDGEPIALSLTSDGVLRSLLSAGLYFGLVAVLGVALGAVIRSTAGGIVSVVAVLQILPGLATLLPGSVEDSVAPYLPSNAGAAVFSLHGGADVLSPGAGLAVFAGWVVLALAAAAIRLKRTDV